MAEMAWYILYPKRGGTKKRCALRKTKPTPVKGYGFAEGPLGTLDDVTHRLNAMNIPASERPMRHGRVI